MKRFDWTWPERAERVKRPALIAASLALHAAVLGYMALRNFETPSLPLWQATGIVIPVELVPVPDIRRPPPRVSAPSQGGERRPLHRPSLHLPSRPDSEASRGFQPPIAPPSPAVEDGWRVRPQGGGVGLRPRRGCVVDGVAREAADCTNWISAAPVDPRTGRSVRVGARTRTVGEQRRQIDLDNQVAYNEAMREFRRGDAPHPGLINALKYQ